MDFEKHNEQLCLMPHEDVLTFVDIEISKQTAEGAVSGWIWNPSCGHAPTGQELGGEVLCCRTHQVSGVYSNPGLGGQPARPCSHHQGMAMFIACCK